MGRMKPRLIGCQETLFTVCSSRILKVSVDQDVPFSLQYGIILYQNYKIPQQRKTLISHFTAPVVSISYSVAWKHSHIC